MSELSQEKCTACRPDAPRVSEEEAKTLLPGIPGWALSEIDGVPRLEKTFSFKNFAEALAFTNKVGTLAEEENHHPAILTEWGKVTVSWWTHKIKGVHRNDFIMAARCQKLV